MEIGQQPEHQVTEQDAKKDHEEWEKRLSERGKTVVDSAFEYLTKNHGVNFPEETRYRYLHKLYVGGRWNDCFTIVNPESNKPEFVIKMFQRDLDPGRYQREQKTISLLERSGLFPDSPDNQIHIPQIVHHDDEEEYTIQRYVESQIDSHSWIRITEQHIKLMAEYVSRVHSIIPSPENQEILPFPATDQVPTPYHVYLDYQKRMQDFKDYYEDKAKYHRQFINQLNESSVMDKINAMETNILERIGHTQLHHQTPSENMRINQNDTSFHNAIQTGEDREVVELCLFDFEYSGWDNPFDMVANFVHHAQSKSIKPELKQLFVDEYVKKMQLTPEQVEDLNARLALAYLEWISIMLRSSLPNRKEKIPRQHAETIDDQIIYLYLDPVNKKLEEDPFAIQAKHPIT
jgi:hypothetical protein